MLPGQAMIDPDQTEKLRSIATAIWGAEWVSPFSRVLGIGLRTAQRWASGKTAVPDWVLTNQNLIDAAIRASQTLRTRNGTIAGFLAEAKSVLPAETTGAEP